MRSVHWVSLALATTIGLSSASLIIPSAAQAVRLRDGKDYFTQPPRLVKTESTQKTIYVRGSIYYFTLEVPQGAGEPLQRVEIRQKDGSTAVQRVWMQPSKTEAFVGTLEHRGAAIPLGTATYDENTQNTVITFSQPVAPGTTVTIALHPERNPRSDGVYLFGVTVFPAGENPYGQFIGYGRFHFYDGGDRVTL